jgi:GNAT superfamily N-acetyltransferase
MEAARPARRDELDHLGELAVAAVAEAAARRGGPQLVGQWLAASSGELAESLGAHLDSERSTLVVGTVEGTVVGFGLAVLDQDRARLEVLYVEPAARAVGVGESILGVVESWARGRGAIALEAPALPGDRDTKQFFEGSGMVARLLTMHRPL